MKLKYLLGAIITGLLITLTGCGGDDNKPSPPPTPVVIDVIGEDDLVVGAGVHPSDDVTVAATGVEDYLNTCYLKSGQSMTTTFGTNTATIAVQQAYNGAPVQTVLGFVLKPDGDENNTNIRIYGISGNKFWNQDTSEEFSDYLRSGNLNVCN